MRRSVNVVPLAVLVLAFAGCGSTNKAATSSSLSSGATRHGAPPPVKPVTYSVKLAGSNGVPAGAPNGSGLAVITMKASSGELCWKFSQLKNVTAPTKARLYHNLPGMPGIPLGVIYRSSGCIGELPALLEHYEANPQRLWVGINTTRFPNGAVRGHL